MPEPSGVDPASRLPQALESVRLSGEIACKICLPFKYMFSLRLGTRPKFHQLVYRACTQKPPDNLAEEVYQWWCTTIPQLRRTIEEHLRNEQPARKEAARASFDSFVLHVSKALAYLDRFYLPRRGGATLEQVAAPEQDALRRAFVGLEALKI